MANKSEGKRVITMRKIGDFLHYHRIFSHYVYLTAVVLFFTVIEGRKKLDLLLQHEVHP